MVHDHPAAAGAAASVDKIGQAKQRGTGVMKRRCKNLIGIFPSNTFFVEAR